MDFHNEFIVDFAQRTLENLEHIDEQVKGIADEERKLYEVTQLVNSLLGLLVFPREQYMKEIPKTPLSELVAKGWPEIKTTRGALPKENLHQLMRMLRNGVAHCNLEFDSDSNHKICGIRIWNGSPCNECGAVTWEATLSIEDLRKIVEKFVELIKEQIGSKDRG